MHREAHRSTLHTIIASFSYTPSQERMFCSPALSRQLRSLNVAFVRPRRGRLVFIQDNCAQVPEGYRWLCPNCGAPMTYVGVADGHGDYGTLLCDIYRCRDCGEEVVGHCIDGGLSN